MELAVHYSIHQETVSFNTEVLVYPTTVYALFCLFPLQVFMGRKHSSTEIPFPRIWGIRNLLYIPATLYRILVRFVKNGRAIILENGVFRVSCCFPRLLLA